MRVATLCNTALSYDEAGTSLRSPCPLLDAQRPMTLGVSVLAAVANTRTESSVCVRPISIDSASPFPRPKVPATVRADWVIPTTQSGSK